MSFIQSYTQVKKQRRWGIHMERIETAVAKVQMLGGFHLTINGVTISDRSNQAKKPWSILQYLITFHKREISSNELIDLIWSTKESANPGGALKTLMFRSRKLLEPLGLPTHHLIIQKNGTYAWNPDIQLMIDTDEFEDLCQRSKNPDITSEQRLELLLQALELYKGDFLPKSSWEAWALPISTFYHSMYLQAAHTAIDLLLEHTDWTRIIGLCQRALAVEPFDEDFHYCLIYALFNNKQQNQALEHYQYMTNLFYNEFAITPSQRLKDLYKLIRNKEHGVTTDLSIIQESMKEAQHSQGAYFCEFSVFRDIFQLEQRSIERTGDSVFLCLLTLQDEHGDLPKLSVMTRAMNHLQTSIFSSLRRGDAYTRYSVSQYMIMLPTASYENGAMVMDRIVRSFKKAYTRKDLVVNYSLQPIVPDMES